MKAMNIPFAMWVDNLANRTDKDVSIKFHEVAYPWVRWPLRHNLIAFVNRWMARRMIQNASTIYVSTTAWSNQLIRLGAQARVNSVANYSLEYS